LVASYQARRGPVVNYRPGNANSEAAGIPQDQISGVHANATMSGGMAPSGVRPPDQLKGYCSVLERSISGVKVSESKAWVRFNLDGAVVEESVYWPELPASLQTDVAVMKGAVAGGLSNKVNAKDALDLTSGDIWIHHSQPWDDRLFGAEVTCDVCRLIFIAHTCITLILPATKSAHRAMRRQALPVRAGHLKTTCADKGGTPITTPGVIVCVARRRGSDRRRHSPPEQSPFGVEEACQEGNWRLNKRYHQARSIWPR
jgi:hypothetical protein